jgi:hypothetical protein
MTVLTFPKIFALGTRYVERLFNGPVEVTEKIDGSQFNFMVANTPEGELIMRSKGAQVFPETKDANFKPVVEWVLSIQSKLVPGAIYHGETLSRPRHNILTYNRVPDGHFMLFGCRDVSGRYECSHYGLEMIADRLRCEVVPLIWAGDFETEIKADKMDRRLRHQELRREYSDRRSGSDTAVGEVRIGGLQGKAQERMADRHRQAGHAHRTISFRRPLEQGHSAPSRPRRVGAVAPRHRQIDQRGSGRPSRRVPRGDQRGALQVIRRSAASDGNPRPPRVVQRKPSFGGYQRRRMKLAIILSVIVWSTAAYGLYVICIWP